MDILCIIPARGGSKGIPGKNIVTLCGKPLLAWSVSAAKHSAFINRVIVSTDDAATDQSLTFVLEVCLGASSSSPFDIGAEETETAATVTFDDFIENIVVNPPTLPSWYNNKTNDTLIYENEVVMFNVTWNDNQGLGNWIFSSNFSGSLDFPKMNGAELFGGNPWLV